MKLNIIFDIDNCIACAIDYQIEEKVKEVKEMLGEELADDLILTACGYPHCIFPGFYALWEWLHRQGVTIMVFSSGVKERNVELIENFTKRSFRHIKEEDRPEIKVFSREDTIDTTTLMPEEEKKYQSYWYGNLKKKLSGAVVTEDALPYSLLIDDDASYTVTNEERNLIRIPFSYTYCPAHATVPRDEDFKKFHKAYYTCGLLKKIMATADERNLTPMMAAEYVQATMEGEVINRDFYFPSQNRIAYYTDGLETLQAIDPTLKFHFEYNKNSKHFIF